MHAWVDMQPDCGRFRGHSETSTYSGCSSSSRDAPYLAEAIADKYFYGQPNVDQSSLSEEETPDVFDHIDTDDELFFPRFEDRDRSDSRSSHQWSSPPPSMLKPRVEASAAYSGPGLMRVAPPLSSMQVPACHSVAPMNPYSVSPYPSLGTSFANDCLDHQMEYWRDPAMYEHRAFAQCSHSFMTPTSTPSTGSLGICPNSTQWSPCEAWPPHMELRDLYGAYDDWSQNSERLDFEDDSDQSDLYSDVSDSDDSLSSNVSEGNLAIDCPDAACAEGCVVFCSICLDDCTSGERIRTVAVCGHQFHADCLETWLQRRGRCPNCRRSVSGHSFD